MHRILIGLAVVFSAVSLQAAELKLNFSEHKLNETPAGFRSTVSGTPKRGDWKVILDDDPGAMAPISPKARTTNQRSVLAQLSRDKTDEHFPLLIYDEEEFDDFVLTTRFKLVAGEVEQMAGMAFRLRDENNYYYVRASALGDSFYFWKIVDGVRSPPIGSKVKIEKGVWHEMIIECQGNRIRALLNGRELIPTLDDKSFTRGKIAFWTKSDAVSHFVDVKVTYTPREILAQRLIREVLKKNPRLRGVKIFAAAKAGSEPLLIASTNPEEIGRPAGASEKDVIARGVIYHGKGPTDVMVTLPMHDSNGEPMAAVTVVMKGFPGQTEKTAIVRALPIVKEMEARVRSVEELTH